MQDRDPLILKRSATGPDSIDRRRLDPLEVDEEKGETIVVPGQLPAAPPYEGDQVARKREAFRRRTISLVVRSEPGDDLNRFDSLEQEMLDHESRRGNSEDIPDSFQKTMLDLKGLPRALRDQLALFDDNDNGELDLGELAQAAVTIQKLRTETDAFSVNAFPKHLQEELEAFDVDGDGKFNASEIIRACRLYHDQKKQLRKMVRGLFILVVVIAIVLGINMSLSFAVTILSKEISVAGNGVMYTKDKDSVVSTGSVEDVVEVFADRDAFWKLTGRMPDEGFYKNHLEIKPEAVALIFADETILNIPVNHMRATKDYVVFGNTILHQEVYMTNGSPPQLTHSSPEDDRLLQIMNATSEAGNRTCGIRNETEDALSDETVTPYHVCHEVPAATVVFIRVYIGKQFIRSYHNASSSNMTLSEKIKSAINITNGGHLTMPERQSVVDAQESNSLVAKELELVPVEDMSQQIQKNPLANVDRGDHSSWTAHFNVSAEEGQGLTFQQLEAFCDILRPLNGECTRNCDGDSCGNNVTSWLSFDFLSFVLPGGNLTALLNHPKMAHGGAELNILLISKSFRVGAPSARVVSAKEADPNQTMRHGQVKELVMATRHGRRLMQRIRAMKAAAAEQHRRRKLLGDVSGMAFYDKIVEGTNKAGPDCYMKEKQYEGVIRITEDNEYCLPWTQEDIDEHAVDLDGLDLLGNVQCAKMNATGGEPPVCPSDFGYSREGRSLVPCAVKHCLEKVYTSFLDDVDDVFLVDKRWGLQRIIANYSDDPTYEGSMSTDELQLDGEGVECYVVDTGVNLDHNEFVSTQGSRSGRLEYDALKGTRDQKDENGHGTHVAGIIAGKTTGIAPRCRIHAVKVLNDQKTNGHGKFGDSIFHGLAVLAKDFRERKKANPNAKGVVNLSLAASSTSATWTSAVRMLHEEGLVVVAAAGNKDEDACSYSPAAEDYAITVGATNIDDTKAIFSNWGSCVQIYAPGSGIKSASYKFNDELIFMSGTSMAAPFVTGAVALYLKAHQSIDVSPDAAARFIYDTAMVGKVHGVDQKRTVYEKYGVTEEKWDFSVRLLNRLDFSASDDTENIAISKDNRLLHVDGQILKDQAALHTCSESGLDDGADQWGPWDLTEDDCPPPGPICGTEKDAPVVVARRRCIATNCICETEFDTKEISCDIKDYEFVPQCGAPAAALESLEDITWLQGKRLRFKPQDSSGNYYDICESETWTVPLEFSAMQGQSMLRKLKGGLAGQVIVSLQHGFWFKAHPQGTMQPYYKITVFASGHIKFGAWKTQYTIFNPQDYTMDTHLGKGLGISGLFTGLDFSNCKFPKCGDLQIRKGVSPDGTPVAIISYYNVPSKHAPLDDPMYKSSFKIILYLGEKRKGEFELVYDSISQTAQKGAVYGVSLGEKSRPALINPNRAISCY